MCKHEAEALLDITNTAFTQSSENCSNKSYDYTKVCPVRNADLALFFKQRSSINDTEYIKLKLICVCFFIIRSIVFNKTFLNISKKIIRSSDMRYARDTFSICSHITIFSAISMIFVMHECHIKLIRTVDYHDDMANICALRAKSACFALRTGHSNYAKESRAVPKYRFSARYQLCFFSFYTYLCNHQCYIYHSDLIYISSPAF